MGEVVEGCAGAGVEEVAEHGEVGGEEEDGEEEPAVVKRRWWVKRVTRRRMASSMRRMAGRGGVKQERF